MDLDDAAFLQHREVARQIAVGQVAQRLQVREQDAVDARVDGILFTDLKALCNLTDGNLSRHLTVLQEGGIVEIHKGFRGRRPQTLCRLTDSGRKRYLEYIAVLESVLADAVDASKATRKTRRVLPEGFSPA